MATLLSTLDGALVLLLALLFPLRLLSLSLRFFSLRNSSSSSDHGRNRRSPATIRSVVALVSAAVLLSSIYATSDLAAPANKDVLTVSQVEEMRQLMESEIEELKLKIVRLESVLEERIRTLNIKTTLLEEENKVIEAMERDIQSLINEQENIKRHLEASS